MARPFPLLGASLTGSGIGSLFKLSQFENYLNIFYKNYKVRLLVRLLISRQLPLNGEISDWGWWMTLCSGVETTSVEAKRKLVVLRRGDRKRPDYWINNQTLFCSHYTFDLSDKLFSFIFIIVVIVTIICLS